MSTKKNKLLKTNFCFILSSFNILIPCFFLLASAKRLMGPSVYIVCCWRMNIYNSKLNFNKCVAKWFTNYTVKSWCWWYGSCSTLREAKAATILSTLYNLKTTRQNVAAHYYWAEIPLDSNTRALDYMMTLDYRASRSQDHCLDYMWWQKRSIPVTASP